MPNRYRDVGLIALTLVILVLANIPGQIALGQARQGSSSEARVAQDLESIAGILGIRPGDAGSVYEYFLRGRIITLCGSQLKDSGLLGVEVGKLHIYAYIGGWIELPFRVYSERINIGNDLAYYTPSTMLSESTCIDIKLPPAIPTRTSLSEANVPSHLRGSRATPIELVIAYKSIEYSIPLYFFESWYSDPSRIYDNLVDYDIGGVNTISGLVSKWVPGIIEAIYLKKDVVKNALNLVSDELFNQYVLDLLKKIGKPINNVVGIEALPPTPIPDGGGGPSIAYNYAERRPMFFNDLIQGFDGSAYPRVSLVLGYSNRSFTGLYPVVDDQTHWSVFNPRLSEIEVKFYVYGNDTSSRTLVITLDGETIKYTVLPNVVNELIFRKYYYWPGKSLPYTINYSISIEPAISYGRVWSITSSNVILYYYLNTSTVIDRARSFLYRFDLFTANSTLGWNVLLDSSHGYTFNAAASIPSPYGGFVYDGINDMMNYSYSYVEIPLRIYGSSDKLQGDWGANITISISVGILYGEGWVYVSSKNYNYPQYVTLVLKPRIYGGTPSSRLYDWIAPLLYSGEALCVITIKPSQLINISSEPIRLNIVPYYPQEYRFSTRVFQIAYYDYSISGKKYLMYSSLLDKASDLVYTMSQYSNIYYASIAAFKADVLEPLQSIFYPTVLHVDMKTTVIPETSRRFKFFDASVNFALSNAFGIDQSGYILNDNYVGYSKLVIHVNSTGINTQSISVGAYGYDAGWGASLPSGLPEWAELAMTVLSLIRKMGGLDILISIFEYGYGFLRTSATNTLTVESTDGGRGFQIRFETGPLSGPAKANFVVYIGHIEVTTNTTVNIEINLFTEVHYGTLDNDALADYYDNVIVAV